MQDFKGRLKAHPLAHVGPGSITAAPMTRTKLSGHDLARNQSMRLRLRLEEGGLRADHFYRGTRSLVM
ncbi:hypothetical protein MPLB_1640037 [Mesorhizobium sp. ORS 3324]|nr:hypothetical protein MPLB_1640037 [Mesorhizobium sp. ORS 3324]